MGAFRPLLAPLPSPATSVFVPAQLLLGQASTLLLCQALSSLFWVHANSEPRIKNSQVTSPSLQAAASLVKQYFRSFS